jgi:hypothetical protein
VLRLPHQVAVDGEQPGLRGAGQQALEEAVIDFTIESRTRDEDFDALLVLRKDLFA